MTESAKGRREDPVVPTVTEEGNAHTSPSSSSDVPAIRARLEEHATQLERASASCRAERGEPPIDVTDTPFDCADCATNAVTIGLLRESLALLSVKDAQIAELEEQRDVFRGKVVQDAKLIADILGAKEAADALAAQLRLLVDAGKQDAEILDAIQDSGRTVREELIAYKALRASLTAQAETWRAENRNANGVEILSKANLARAACAADLDALLRRGDEPHDLPMSAEPSDIKTSDSRTSSGTTTGPEPQA